MSMDAGTTQTRRLLSPRLAAEIRAEMGRQNISGRKLALRVGRSANWVSQKTSGAHRIDVDDLQEIADGLAIDPETLVKRANPSIASYATLPVPAGSRRPPSGPPGGSTRPAGRGDSSRPTSDRRTALTGR